MEQLGTAFLAGIQKSNGLDIHKRHSVKVHRNPRLITVHLGLQFIEMLRFNVICDFCDVDGKRNCNEETKRNFLKCLR